MEWLGAASSVHDLPQEVLGFLVPLEQLGALAECHSAKQPINNRRYAVARQRPACSADWQSAVSPVGNRQGVEWLGAASSFHDLP